MNVTSDVGGRSAGGGCMCGAVRIRAIGDPSGVIYCHCRDCRASSGAPVSLFAGFRAGQVERLQGEPRGYRSSARVVRSFCPECGTPLSYEDEDLPGEVYVPVGIFDDPGTFAPGVHEWVSQRLRWFDVRDGLPRHEESSVPR